MSNVRGETEVNGTITHGNALDKYIVEIPLTSCPRRHVTLEASGWYYPVIDSVEIEAVYVAEPTAHYPLGQTNCMELLNEETMQVVEETLLRDARREWAEDGRAADRAKDREVERGVRRG
jgi:hypothetical protein